MTAWGTSVALALTGVILTTPVCADITTKPARDTRQSASVSADERVKAAQQALRDNGLDPGAVDGFMGPKTQQAIRDFQQAQRMEATGELDPKTMHALGIDEMTGATDASSGSASPASASGTGAGMKK